MNLKIKALLYSLGILAASAVAGLAAVEIVKMISISLLPWIGVGFLLIMAFYVIYNMLLSEMETQARIESRLKELREQK